MSDEDHFDCATCGQSVFMGDLAAVFFHEHKGITDNVDLSGVSPGKRVEPGQEEEEEGHA